MFFPGSVLLYNLGWDNNVKSLSINCWSWGIILGNSYESLSKNFNLIPTLWLLAIKDLSYNDYNINYILDISYKIFLTFIFFDASYFNFS